MRWPWVNRALHDQVVETANELVEHLKQRCDRAELQLVKERARIDELTGEIIRMRREGFVPEPEPPRQDAAGPQLAQDVLDAIEERAATAAMRRQLRTVAERMTRDGKETSAIVSAILEGERFEEDFVG